MLFASADLTEQELALQAEVRSFLAHELPRGTFTPGLGMAAPRDPAFSAKLGKWDLISIPAGVYHDINNNFGKPCAVQTLLSKPRPDRPRYQDPRLLDLQAATYTA